MLRASVTGSFDVEELRRRVDLAARESVEAGARAGANAARAVARKRVRSGQMAAIVAVEAEVIRQASKGRGYRASFVSPAGHAWYQNDGTLGSRSKPLKRAASSARAHGPGTGVKALRFLDIGRAAGFKAMLGRARNGSL